VLVSSELELPIVKLVPTDLAVICKNPVVPPGVWEVKKIRLFAVIVVLDTVTEPADRVEVPNLQFEP
jgi:hypothetical protein